MTASLCELEDEIAQLRDLDLPDLRARWHSVFRRKAPWMRRGAIGQACPTKVCMLLAGRALSQQVPSVPAWLGANSREQISHVSRCDPIHKRGVFILKRLTDGIALIVMPANRK
jgi:hypothetical protein